MSVNSQRQRLIKWVRRYPVIALSALALGYLLGGFSETDDGPIPQQIVITALYLFISLVPLGFIIAFLVVGRLGDLESAANKEKQSNLTYQDAFDLPSQIMHGYKLAMVTGRSPTLTGLTGDRYLSDAKLCVVRIQNISHRWQSVSVAFMPTKSLLMPNLSYQLIPVHFY
jgi:hypothetical protein